MVETGICLDTNALIAYLKDREPGASAVEKATRNYTCFVSTITVYELMFGVARAKKEIGENALLDILITLPFDESAARKAALLHDELIRNNADIGVKDVMIAAICLNHDLAVLTANVRHFERVPRLKILSPEQILTGTAS